MLRPREYADEPTEHQLEPALRVLQRKFRDRWLVSYDELQFGNEIHNELPVQTYRPTKGVAPFAQLCLARGQKRAQKALMKGLCQSGIRNVALVLIKLA